MPIHDMIRIATTVTARTQAALPFHAGSIDYVLVTHAHIDHSGNIPLLFKNGYTGPVYATEATCQLCEIMLRDCAHIQESEAEWQSRKAKRSGGSAVEPVYGTDDDVQWSTARFGIPAPSSASADNEDAPTSKSDDEAQSDDEADFERKDGDDASPLGSTVK